MRPLVCSSATGSRQMFGEMTFASPEAASRTPNAPTNCQRRPRLHAAERGGREDHADQVHEREHEDEGQASKSPFRLPSAGHAAPIPVSCGNNASPVAGFSQAASGHLIYVILRDPHGLLSRRALTMTDVVAMLVVFVAIVAILF